MNECLRCLQLKIKHHWIIYHFPYSLIALGPFYWTCLQVQLWYVQGIYIDWGACSKRVGCPQSNTTIARARYEVRTSKYNIVGPSLDTLEVCSTFSEDLCVIWPMLI